MTEEPEKQEKPMSEGEAKFRAKLTQKSKEDKTDFVQSIATREKLERDYKEDIIYVTFKSSPETERTIVARRPNQEEFLQILRLTIESAKYVNVADLKSLESLEKTYATLHKIAASLCINKELDEKFWKTKISFGTLQNFIGELINASQTQFGGVTESEVQKFRGK